MKMNQDMDKIKVLLVEDEQTLAMIIKDTLEGQNFIIHTAADGEEGLRMFFDLRPDVLVADVMMPRMDGFEMVRHIRQTDKRMIGDKGVQSLSRQILFSLHHNISIQKFQAGF